MKIISFVYNNLLGITWTDYSQFIRVERIIFNLEIFNAYSVNTTQYILCSILTLKDK